MPKGELKQEQYIQTALFCFRIHCTNYGLRKKGHCFHLRVFFVLLNSAQSSRLCLEHNRTIFNEHVCFVSNHVS